MKRKSVTFSINSCLVLIETVFYDLSGICYEAWWIILLHIAINVHKIMSFVCEDEEI